MSGIERKAAEILGLLISVARARVDSTRQAGGRVGGHSRVHAALALVVALTCVISVAVPAAAAPDGTWSGEVQLSANPATDGTEFSYPLDDLDAASDPVVNLTGVLNTEWDNETASGVGTSSTQDVSLSGTSVSGPSANGNPTLSVTADVVDTTHNPMTDVFNGDSSDHGTSIIAGDDSSDQTWDLGAQIQPSKSGVITSLSPEIGYTAGSDYGVTVSVYIVKEGVDGAYGEGRKVATWDPDWSSTRQTFSIDNYSVSAGETYTVEFVSSGSDGDGTRDAIGLAVDRDVSENWISTQGSLEPDVGNLNVDIQGGVSNLAVSDGNGVSHTFGDFSDGETKTTEFNASTASTHLDWSGSGGGSFNWTLKVKEQTQTTDPGVELNNETVSHSGKLSEGETASLSLPKDALREGENEVTVSVGDGLSADAPAAKVGVEYSHTAASSTTVSTVSNQLQDQYNVSRTFASGLSNTSLSLSYASDVVQFGSIELRTEGSDWQSISESEWRIQDGSIIVPVGDVSTNDTVAVRATAQKVDTKDGSITVVEPSAPEDSLNSKVRIDDRGSNFAIVTNGTRVHYGHDASYDGADMRAYVTADGTQELRLPNAQSGSTLRVSQSLLSVEPVTGDVMIDVETRNDPMRFVVSPGESGGDAVDYTWHGGSGGLQYTLYSMTFGEPRSEAVSGGGPVLLQDDDSPETLQISSAAATGSGAGGPGSSQTFLQAVVDLVRGGGFVALAAALLGGLFLLGSRYGEDSGVVSGDTSGFGLAAVGGLILLPILLEAINPGAISSRIGAGVAGALEAVVGPVAIFGTIGILAIIGLWVRNQDKEAPTFNVRAVRRNSSKDDSQDGGSK